MSIYRGQAILVLVAIVIATSSLGVQQKRPITVEDCVSTRRILSEGFDKPSPVQIAPDGSSVAYIVKSPNLKTNKNDYQLYIRNVNQYEPGDTGRLVLQAARISEIKWIGQNLLAARTLKALEKGSESEVDVINPSSGSVTKLEFPVPAAEFSISFDGKVIAFSSVVKNDLSASSEHPSQPTRDARGYPIIFGLGTDGESDEFPKDEIYVGKITHDGKVEASKMYFTGPVSEPRRSVLALAEDLKISPDGKYLLLKYSAPRIPEDWVRNPVIKEYSGLGTRAESHVLVLCNLTTGQTRVAFNYPGALISASWADDSQSYSVISPSPFGSDEEIKETGEASAFGRLFYYLFRFNHVFAVDLKSTAVTNVVHRDSGQPGEPRFLSDFPLAWKKSDEMIVRTGDTTFARMHLSAGTWRELARFELPRDGLYRSMFASDGRVLAGVSQGLATPPDLFVQNIKTGQSILLTDLNPDYRGITLGDVEKIEWSNRYGSKCVGKLVKPVGYEPARRYPLVLMANYSDADEFITDGHYTMAFAPQSLANAGFVVLMAQYPREDKYPRGEFPGDMGQAYNWISMMESAVDLLAAKGIVDRGKVGIVGFSRTSWLTDFMLTHSPYKFMAASSADSGIYTYGGYFRYNRSPQLLRGSETQIGGPPYQDTLKYWLEYAPPFNAEKVTTPLMMEYTGSAEHGLEFFVALSRLGKPVEFYRYPKGEHPLDTPFERIASLQRNVDWFRFWMQGYEGKAPEYDPDQCVRWRKLREQKLWNDRMSSQGQDPSAEFLRQTAPGALVREAERAPAAKEFFNY